MMPLHIEPTPTFQNHNEHTFFRVHLSTQVKYAVGPSSRSHFCRAKLREDVVVLHAEVDASSLVKSNNRVVASATDKLAIIGET